MKSMPARLVAADPAEELRRRAALVARRREPDPLLAGGAQALRFTVRDQACLLELGCLREVQALRELLPLPMAAPSLLGMVQWRGRMLPLLDLALLLALPPASASTPPGRVLVLGRKLPVLALAVGEVHGVQPLGGDDPARRLEALEGLRPEIVRGIASDGSLVLDGPRLLALHGGPAA
jgi:purine-binding chemotaxis protein CheW